MTLVQRQSYRGLLGLGGPLGRYCSLGAGPTEFGAGESPGPTHFFVGLLAGVHEANGLEDDVADNLHAPRAEFVDGVVDRVVEDVVVAVVEVN